MLSATLFDVQLHGLAVKADHVHASLREGKLLRAC